MLAAQRGDMVDLFLAVGALTGPQLTSKGGTYYDASKHSLFSTPFSTLSSLSTSETLSVNIPLTGGKLCIGIAADAIKGTNSSNFIVQFSLLLQPRSVYSFY